jgi:hypothetical protein
MAPEKKNYFFFLPFFFFFIAMVVFLRVSVRSPADGQVSVADTVIQPRPLPCTTMACRAAARN